MAHQHYIFYLFSPCYIVELGKLSRIEHYHSSNGPSSFILHWYSALRPVWKEPEPSQTTGMALARCILGNFLG